MPAIGRWCAVAVMVTPDRRYLLQLRDDKPTIFLPDHWALFGGAIEPGEDAAAGLRRELEEELRFTPGAIAPFTEMVLELPLAPPRRDRMSFFTVPIETRDLDAMVQQEGAAMRLFAAPEMAALPRVSPWDLAVVLMHARQAALFGR